MAKALHLQRVLCYNGALNLYQLLLRLRVLLVDSLIVHKRGVLCPRLDEGWHTETAEGEVIHRSGKTYGEFRACQEDHITLTDDHLLDLIRVEEDITRKLAYVQGNQPFEVEDQEYFSFTRPSRRYYLSKRR